jgi:hypothetical protein
MDSSAGLSAGLLASEMIIAPATVYYSYPREALFYEIFARNFTVQF